MNSPFSKALELDGMSPTTAGVVWSMVAFLVLLTLGIGFIFKKQLDKRSQKKTTLVKNSESGKGF